MVELIEVPCPLCGARADRTHLLIRDLKFFTPGEYRLAACTACGFVYLNPRPTPAAIATLYPEGYWVEAEPDREPVAPHLVERAIEQVGRHCPGGRVLDVGCGTGVAGAVMQRLGLKVTGLDPSADACRAARERFGLEVIESTIEAAELPEGGFDAITMFDVLEHLYDPKAVLSKLRRALRPGGLLIAKMPNLAAWQARLCGPYWFALDSPRHLSMFTPATARRMLEVGGYARVASRAHPDPDGPFMFEVSVLYRLRERQWRGQPPPAPVAAEAEAGHGLEGKVYPGVSARAKRAFRWLVRNVGYAPLALENVLGHSVTLLASGYRPT